MSSRTANVRPLSGDVLPSSPWNRSRAMDHAHATFGVDTIFEEADVGVRRVFDPYHGVLQRAGVPVPCSAGRQGEAVHDDAVVPAIRICAGVAVGEGERQRLGLRGETHARTGSARRRWLGGLLRRLRRLRLLGGRRCLCGRRGLGWRWRLRGWQTLLGHDGLVELDGCTSLVLGLDDAKIGFHETVDALRTFPRSFSTRRKTSASRTRSLRFRLPSYPLLLRATQISRFDG